MRFRYTLAGVVEVPDGSKPSECGGSIILPCGCQLRVWEAWERQSGDHYHDMSFDELESMGIFYDGEAADFEEAEPDRGGPAAVQAAGDT